MMSKKTICILVGVLILAVFVAIKSTQTYFHWTRTQYFGEITEIQNDGFILKTDGGPKIRVITNQNTIVKKGNSVWTENLRIGDFVLVIGAVNQGGSVKGEAIRIVDPPRPRL